MANVTPSDVRNIAFNKPPLGRRGYDEDEVDSFLDEIERTLIALYREIEQLRAETAPTPHLESPAFPTGFEERTVASELDLIKRRLAQVEATLDQRDR